MTQEYRQTDPRSLCQRRCHRKNRAEPLHLDLGFGQIQPQKKPPPLRCSGPGWRGGRTVARGSTLKGATGDAIVTRSVPRGMCRVDRARQKHLALPLRGGVDSGSALATHFSHSHFLRDDAQEGSVFWLFSAPFDRGDR